VSEPGDKLIRLGGREFRPVEDGTIEHDYWLMGLIRRAGMDRVVMQEGESPDEFASRIMFELMASEHAFSILGGAMMPADKDVCDWTPAMAADTAAFLKHLTSAEDKQTLNACTASLVADFFVHGLATLMTSRKYSSPLEAPASPSENVGDWDALVRELAGHDPARMVAVVRWPVREALLAYVDRMKQAELEQFRWNTLTWWVSADKVKKPGKPPAVPPILRRKS
jgi:hypothetical protein